MTWDDAAIERLRAYRDDGFSATQIGLRMGVGRGAILSAVRRYIHCVPDERVRATKPHRYKVVPRTWSEAALTEPWVQYRARRVAERRAQT